MRRESAGFTRAAVLLCILLLLNGCIEIDQGIVVDRNLRGTADLLIGIDLFPMFLIGEHVAGNQEGKAFPPSEAELEELRADFKKRSPDAERLPLDLEQMNAEMPEGVRVLAADAKSDTKVVSSFRFEFDHLSKLVGIKTPRLTKDDDFPRAIVASPFEGLVVTEKGGIISIRSTPLNLADKVIEQESDPKKRETLEDVLKISKPRFSFRITAPFGVVSHNATRRDGNTLIWEYDLKRFEEMSKAGSESIEIQVSYRR